MVIVVVADQHDIDGRQIIPRYSRFSPPPRTRPGQRTRSFGPDWVRQNIASPLLKENRRVVHQSGSQSAPFQPAGRYSLIDVRKETRRRVRPTDQPPTESPKKTPRP